ncbi:putative ABC transport system permease protein [Chryseolinea serpens]|uniref:Putative ABC transport system permease protein n=1 Tax=Chryseolinea serpens TaxID=947013 RepID=A0A1M5LW70_9BACT|nr:ABC transporter permease [Chryseolinea serpens]SHG69308.1 putative ABC transport system permease protein [Chryseolinea serpens]
MTLFTLVWNYLKARPLNTAINIILLSLGIAVVTILLLFNTQLEQKITDNARGIDLVVGAKGSPLQLILCNIFHVDFPTGNIKLKEAEKIARNRLVKRAIPMALGDSYQTYRIVGTSRDYADLYKGELAQGDWWEHPLDVTLGANVKSLTQLKIGDTFASSHGLTTTGDDHKDHLYKVKGVLKKNNTVLDNIILTAVESIWEVHEHADTTAHVHETRDTLAMPSRLVPSVAANDSVKEVTSLLLQYRSPMGAIQLPRIVNAQSSLQAASPAFETARLFSILGVGADIIMAFAYVLIAISGLSIFIALYNSLKERRYDMAIMRSMGATRTKLFVSVLLEGGLLTLMGSVIGLLMGHGVLMLLNTLVEETQKAGIGGMVFYSQEWIILGGSLLLGLVCALIPALQAYRTDISKVLASN